MLCEKCGKEIADGMRLCNDCASLQNQSKGLRYASIILAALGVILPFLHWLEVPVAKGLYSMFGMGEETPGFSLFSYIFAGSQYQNGVVFLVMMLLALITLIGIIFNVIYIVKSLRNKPKCYKYGTIGAIILTVMSVLFIIVVGLMSLVLQIIKLTAVPYVMLAVVIANIVVVKMLKKKSA